MTATQEPPRRALPLRAGPPHAGAHRGGGARSAATRRCRVSRARYTRLASSPRGTVRPCAPRGWACMAKAYGRATPNRATPSWPPVTHRRTRQRPRRGPLSTMRATGLLRRCPATCPLIPMARASRESGGPAGGRPRRARHSRRRPGPRRRPAAASPHPGNPAARLPPGRTSAAQPGPAVPPVPADHSVPAAHPAPATRSSPGTRSSPDVRPGGAAPSAMAVRPARRWQPVAPPLLGQGAAARGPPHRTRAACPPPAVPQRVPGSGRPAAGTSGAGVARMAAQRPQQPAARTAAADLHRPQPNTRMAADLHRPPQAAARTAATDMRRLRWPTSRTAPTGVRRCLPTAGVGGASPHTAP